MEFEVFYDGDCPLCKREIDLLRYFDRKKRILFTDIAAENFRPESLGLSMETLMDRIHGRDARGNMVEGVEVFRRLYMALGLGWLVKPTRLPIIPMLWMGLTGFLPETACASRAVAMMAAAKSPPRPEPSVTIYYP